MAEITLKAERGRTTGSSASRRLRSSGRIPGVVYGHGHQAVSVSIDAREFRHALSGDAGLNQLLNLEVGSESLLTMARVLQRHPVRNTVVHVDFQIVSRTEIITADVPIIHTGVAKAVFQEQGVIEQPLTTLTVNSLPANIPNELVVDISEMAIGDTIRVGDLALPRDVTTDVDPEEAVIIAATSAVAAEAEELAEEEAAEAAEAAEAEAEGEAGEGAGDEAPAGDAGAGSSSEEG
ncbi:MAG: 50S ribosomal protein L25 [Acidimicrobiales bacterium]